jgi:transcription elongation GreA/GreB family factor
MNKADIVQKIIEQLNDKISVLTKSAKEAHEVATSEEFAAKSKYETFALESSYLAEGQAKRAEELREALEAYQVISNRKYSKNTPIDLTALITLEDEEGKKKTVYLGPFAGGMKLKFKSNEVTVVTPSSPLGKALVGRKQGEVFEFAIQATMVEYEISKVE